MRIKTPIIFFVLILAISMLASGCAWFKIKQEKTAHELAVEGEEAYKDKDYRYSLELFQELKDRYPFSKYALLAELRVSDCHYYRKEYDEAIVSYEEFEKLHPKNEAVPYVIYQAGACYFEQLDTIDRDQAPAREAKKIFERLIREHHGSEYVKNAQEHLKACVKSLAEHEFYVGYFYYKGKHYKAALERFLAVDKEYPETETRNKALEYIALCRAKI